MKEEIKVVPSRVIVLYPDTRGFAYAVMEDENTLIEYNHYDFYRFDEERTLRYMRKTLRLFTPGTLVLEDTSCKYSRKGKRAKRILKTISRWAKDRDIPIEYYSRQQIRATFHDWSARSKYQIAKFLSTKFESLEPIMYDKPKYPNRERSVEAVFVAVSLGITRYYMND